MQASETGCCVPQRAQEISWTVFRSSWCQLRGFEAFDELTGDHGISGKAPEECRGSHLFGSAEGELQASL